MKRSWWVRGRLGLGLMLAVYLLGLSLPAPEPPSRGAPWFDQPFLFRLADQEELSRDGMVLRIALRTQPRQQFEVRRELNRRLKIRFDKEGLRFPDPS